ncbi:tRNA synthetase, partial [Oryctes borbonicus]
MLDLYTNENNPAALKILIAGNFSKTDINVKIVQTNDRKLEEPKILPYLEIAANRTIFMANTAARYLFPPQKNESECEHWISWESIILSPLIVQIGGNTKSDTLKSSLISCLKYLNENIKENISLIDSEVQVCDIIIWSTLYPLYNDPNFNKEYFNGFDELITWLTLLESSEAFQTALNTIKITTGASAYSALVNGMRCAPSIPLNLSISGVNNSPQHAVEAVTTEEVNAAKEAWLNNVSQISGIKDEVYPVLPKPGEKNVLITSALPYVNNVPHLGNIIGCVLSADVFARFSRLCNYNTLFICGTDEYGTATETKALEEGLTPQQICDKYFEIHNSIYRWFNIGFDYFGRTTTPEQTKIVQEMFLTLNNNGFMQIQVVDQLLCENCNRYLADRFVEGVCPHLGCNYEDARGDQCDGCGKLVNAVELKNPRCKICSKPPVIRNSQQYFLDLPKLEPLLLHWIEKSAPGWSHK